MDSWVQIGAYSPSTVTEISGSKKCLDQGNWLINLTALWAPYNFLSSAIFHCNEFSTWTLSCLENGFSFALTLSPANFLWWLSSSWLYWLYNILSWDGTGRGEYKSNSVSKYITSSQCHIHIVCSLFSSLAVLSNIDSLEGFFVVMVWFGFWGFSVIVI